MYQSSIHIYTLSLHDALPIWFFAPAFAVVVPIDIFVLGVRKAGVGVNIRERGASGPLNPAPVDADLRNGNYAIGSFQFQEVVHRFGWCAPAPGSNQGLLGETALVDGTIQDLRNMLRVGVQYLKILRDVAVDGGNRMLLPQMHLTSRGVGILRRVEPDQTAVNCTTDAIPVKSFALAEAGNVGGQHDIFHPRRGFFAGAGHRLASTGTGADVAEGYANVSPASGNECGFFLNYCRGFCFAFFVRFRFLLFAVILFLFVIFVGILFIFRLCGTNPRCQFLSLRGTLCGALGAVRSLCVDALDAFGEGGKGGEIVIGEMRARAVAVDSVNSRHGVVAEFGEFFIGKFREIFGNYEAIFIVRTLIRILGGVNDQRVAENAGKFVSHDRAFQSSDISGEALLPFRS